MTREQRVWLSAGLLSLIGAVQACGKAALPAGCTEADYAALTATCPSEAECNAQIDEKRNACAKKIEAE